jgi:hypothetical protein
VVHDLGVAASLAAKGAPTFARPAKLDKSTGINFEKWQELAGDAESDFGEKLHE